MNYDPILLHQSLESQHASHSSNFHHLYNACETASATRIAVNKKKAANVLCETNTPSVAFAIVQEECIMTAKPRVSLTH